MTRADAIAYGVLTRARASHLRSDGRHADADVLDGYVSELDADIDREERAEEPGLHADLMRVIA